MLNNTAKTGNFLVYIGNIYDVDKRFFVKVKKSKYIPLFIIAGLRQENTIRPTCFSFHSIGRADCANRPLPYKRDLSRFSVRP